MEQGGCRSFNNILTGFEKGYGWYVGLFLGLNRMALLGVYTRWEYSWAEWGCVMQVTS
jgi:hypothetical protein